MRIVFFGTPEFAAYSLKRIIKEGFEIVCVVTAPDKPYGRGRKLKSSEVKVVALENNIKILQPTNLKSEEFQNELKALNADLGVVIAFRMLPEKVWSMPKLGTVNLHGSLLPQYRGAAPIQHTIINGEKETGVTTFFLKHEIDTGNLILRRSTDINDKITAGDLYKKLMTIGADVMVETLKLISLHGIDTPQIPQEEMSTLKNAPKLNREFCKIDLKKSTVDIYNFIRGLSPYPAAWLNDPVFGENKIIQATIISNKNDSNLKGLQIINNQLQLFLVNGVLEINQIKPSGKGLMNGKDFVNGLKNRID